MSGTVVVRQGNKFQPKCRDNMSKRIETRNAAARFETRDRPLRAPNSLRQLRLHRPPPFARLSDPFRQLEGVLGCR